MKTRKNNVSSLFRSAMTESDFSCVETRFFSRSRHCASVLQTQVPKLCTDLDLSLLYILILGRYSKFARKNNFRALGVCVPQPCSCASRRFAASRLRLQTYWRIIFVCATIFLIKCIVKWIPLRICVRSRNTQPHLKYQEPGQGVGVGFCHSCHSVKMRTRPKTPGLTWVLAGSTPPCPNRHVSCLRSHIPMGTLCN